MLEKSLYSLLAQADIHRRDDLRNQPEALAEIMEGENTRFIVVSEYTVAVDETREHFPPAFFTLAQIRTIPWLSQACGQPMYLGSVEGTHYFSYDATHHIAALRTQALESGEEWEAVGPQVERPRTRDVLLHPNTHRIAGLVWGSLRNLAPWWPANAAALVVEAVALTNMWHDAKYCAHCGGALRVQSSGWNAICEEGHVVFPRTDVAVIMAITDEENRLLLAHNGSWEKGRYSLVAGFVEAGETPEAAVRREVWEETDIEVGHVEYAGSQPWPFPRSLMLGFRGKIARGASTQVIPDGSEITQAQFFSHKEFFTALENGHVVLPGRSSIAYMLISHWAGRDLSSHISW